MKIQLKLHGRFTQIFGAKERPVQLKDGANIRDLLDHLCDTDERRMKIFDRENKNLGPNVVVRKNGRFIIHLNWLDTSLEEGNRVEILTLHCGG
ncbi:MAG: MoaD/ThiS family protein [Desulfatiglandaceae bacterium]